MDCGLLLFSHSMENAMQWSRIDSFCANETRCCGDERILFLYLVGDVNNNNNGFVRVHGIAGFGTLSFVDRSLCLCLCVDSCSSFPFCFSKTEWDWDVHGVVDNEPTNQRHKGVVGSLPCWYQKGMSPTYTHTHARALSFSNHHTSSLSLSVSLSLFST